MARAGVHFAERPSRQPGKRTVREVVGLDSRLLTAWSSRREAIALAQQATLETREAKHEPRSLAEQRVAWRQQALGVLDSPADLAAMLDRVLGRAPAPHPSGVSEVWVRSAAARVLGTVSGQRASWQFWHVRAEAERVVRGAGLAPGDVESAVSRVTERAL